MVSSRITLPFTEVCRKLIKGDGFVLANIYASIYVKSYKDTTKEQLKRYFSKENIVAEKLFSNVDSVHLSVRSGSEENLYHLTLEVDHDESEKARNLLSNWLQERKGAKIHITPCIRQ